MLMFMQNIRGVNLYDNTRPYTRVHIAETILNLDA
jgi:hypothetical protein